MKKTVKTEYINQEYERYIREYELLTGRLYDVHDGYGQVRRLDLPDDVKNQAYLKYGEITAMGRLLEENI